MQTARIALWVSVLSCTLGLASEVQAARWKDQPKPIYLSFQADANSVQPGGSATLSWAASQDVRCKAYGGWEGRKSASGTYQATSISAPTEFGLSCGNGRNRVDKTLLIDVVQVEPLPPAPPENKAPLVSAGLDQRITLPADAALNGAVSDDGLPNGTMNASWLLVSGPGAAVFSNASSTGTTASFSEAGTYTLRLTASDGELSVSDDMQVFVASEVINQAPLVSAGANQRITLPDAAKLSGQISDDGLPSATTNASWQMVSGPGNTAFGNLNSAATTVTFSQDGVYVLRLTASDGELSNYDEVSVTVEQQVNTPPTVTAGDDQSIALPNSITLQGQVSDDGVPGTGTSVRWSVASGPEMVDFANPTSSNTTATFTAEGTYVLRLSANDGELSTYDDVVVLVEPDPNIEEPAPVAYQDLSKPIVETQYAAGVVYLTWTEANAASYRVLYWLDKDRMLNEIVPEGLEHYFLPTQPGAYTLLVEAYDDLGNSLFSDPQYLSVNP